MSLPTRRGLPEGGRAACSWEGGRPDRAGPCHRGAGKGIGLAIAETPAAAGATVVAGSHGTTPEPDALVDKGHVSRVPVDRAEPDAAGRLVEAAGGPIDILIDNVGTAPARTGGFLSVTDEEWRRTVDLNLLGAVRVTRAVLPSMPAAERGSVVTIGSVDATLPDPSSSTTARVRPPWWRSPRRSPRRCRRRSESKEAGPKGVRVNTVSPGPVETELWLGGGGVVASVSAAAGTTPEDVVAQASGATVTGRFSKPPEVADLVVLLAGDRASNITGSDFVIDGGLIPTW
ncbi:SDR family oxidoreductase [Streptomyces sp. NPDC088747]|uniref:SDR family oxidoreductase n=1 Tax=Streptomyces sp. NPDC088747 TaxID=3365886 RepID=UPI00381907D5